MHLIHSQAVQLQDPAADGIFTHELAVNPLSVVLIKLAPLNDTGTIGDFVSYLELCDAINRVSILHRGQSIFNMTGRDAAMMAALRNRAVPWMANHALTNNHRICGVLPIFLGRRAYDPKSCFPASRSGELVLELDLDVADTGYDDLQYSVDTIELMGASPTEYERKVSLSRTFGASGINDVDLPVGNLVRGILCFGTTSFTGATPAPTLGRIKTVVDNVEIGYSSIDFEVAHSLPGLRGMGVPAYDGHIHGTDGTILPSGVGSGGWQNYCFLDFDPMHDDSLSLDTNGMSRFQVRSDAEAAEAVRMIPIERIKV
jgi:hypothetical protein